LTTSSAFSTPVLAVSDAPSRLESTPIRSNGGRISTLRRIGSGATQTRDHSTREQSPFFELQRLDLHRHAHGLGEELLDIGRWPEIKIVVIEADRPASSMSNCRATSLGSST
jgi:hypothetical protein